MAERGKKSHHGSRLSYFYVIYLAVTAILILIVFIWLGKVSDILAEYEAAQPKYVAAEAFERYFAPIDYTSLLRDAQYDAELAETDEIINYLKEEIGDSELTYSLGSTNQQNEIKYTVKAGHKQLASIGLTVSESQTEHGFPTYELSNITLFLNIELEPPKMYFDIPASYSVMVDGETLTKESITSSYMKTDLMRFYPEDVVGIEYCIYTIAVPDKLPEEVIVADSEGTQAELSFDESTSTYTAGIIYSETLETEYTEFLTAAMKTYGAYVQAVRGVGLKNISRYFDPESNAYENVKATGTEEWMVRTGSNNDIEDLQIGEFYEYSADVFSCHISFTQVLHNGNEDYVDYIDRYVFLHRTDDGYKIYEWYNV